MAQKTQTILELSFRDKASAQLARVKKKIDKMGKTADSAAQKWRKFKNAMDPVAGGLLAIGAAAAAAAVEFAKLEDSAGRLENEFKRAGASTEQVAKAMALAEKNALRYGISIVESQAAIQKFTKRTGDAEAALEAYALAVDISKQENMDLAEVTEILSNARNGELGELKKFRGINEELAATYQQSTDKAKTYADAIGVLTEEYKGSAEALSGTQDQIDSWGQAISVLLSGAGEYFLDFLKEVNEATINVNLTAQNTVYAFRRFGDAIEETYWRINFSEDEVAKKLKERAGIVEDSNQKIIDSEKKRAEASEAFYTAEATRAIQQQRIAKAKEDVASQKAAEAAKAKSQADKASQSANYAELKRREEIAELQLLGLTYEAELLKLQDQELTKSERLLALRELEKQKAEERKRLADELAEQLEQKEQAEADAAAQAREVEVRQQAAAYRLQELEYKAELLELEQSGLEGAEKALALRDIELRQQQRITKARQDETAAAKATHSELLDGLKQSQDLLNFGLQLAGQVGASEGELAAIRAGMEFAMGLSESVGALAVGAPPNIPASIAHFSAAAQYTAVAAKAGKTPVGTGAGAAGAATQALNVEALNQANQQAQAQAQTVNYNLDFRRATGVGPEAARDISQEVSRANRLNLGGVL